MQTHIFDWRTETWSRGPDMNAARWYPGVAALSNGEALIVAGGPATAEVYQTNGVAAPVDRLLQLRPAVLSVPGASAGREGRAHRTGQPDGHHEHRRRRCVDGDADSGRHRSHVRQLRHLRHRQGAGGRWRQRDRGRSAEGPHPNRLDRGRRRIGHDGAPHGLDVGRPPDVGPHAVGRRQCLGHGRAESVGERAGRPRQFGLRGRALGPGDRETGPSSPVPTASGSTIPRPPCCRTAG